MNEDTTAYSLLTNDQEISSESGWRALVEHAIVHFLANNPSSSREFRTRDLHDNYGEWLQNHFPDNTTIEATTNRILNGLVDVHNQIERIEIGRYKLVTGERLYLRVELEKSHRKLQTIAEIISSS